MSQRDSVDVRESLKMTGAGRRKLRHPDKPGTIVVVAVHGSRPIPPGTLFGILEDAGLTVDEFKELL